MAQAEKLESLNLLASGIAHDVNNLLTIMLGNLSLIEAETAGADLPPALRQPLTEIEKALLRSRGLSDQLLTFASSRTPRHRSSDLGELVRSSAGMVFRGDLTAFSLDLPESLPPVDVDPEQIVQVLNNLLLTTSQCGASMVEISVEKLRVGLGKTKLKPGSYVKLRISDNGAGLSPRDVATLFDPYSSTQMGTTGMGLATSHAIIKRHRGAIEVESELGRGTTFTVLLRTAKISDSAHGVATVQQRAAAPDRGRILVMDDEHSILTFLRATFKRMGFDAVTTTDGDAAIAAARTADEQDSPFLLAILDLNIPGGVGGVEAAKSLRRSHPDLLLVASSGYAQKSLMVNPQQHGFDAALSKPYRISDLGQLVNRMVGAAAQE